MSPIQYAWQTLAKLATASNAEKKRILNTSSKVRDVSKGDRESYARAVLGWRDRKSCVQKGNSRPESFYQRGGPDAGRNRWKKVEGGREPEDFDELYRTWYRMSRLVGIANFIYTHFRAKSRDQDSSAREVPSKAGTRHLAERETIKIASPPVLTHGEIDGADGLSE